MLGLFNLKGMAGYVGLGAIAVAGWTAWYLEDSAHTRTVREAASNLAQAESNNRALEESLSAQRVAVEQLLAQHAQHAEDRARMAEINTSILKEKELANAKLDAYKHRMGEALSKKGSLVARRANRATRVLIEQLNAATCRADCPKGPGSPSGTGSE